MKWIIALSLLGSSFCFDARFSYTCPRGHASLNGSGMCNQADCPFRRR